MIDIKLLEKQFKFLKIYGSDTAIHTPFKLVEEMLDKLPIDWSNPDLTFLDPCCGRGTFLICIYNRLFNSLKSIIINDQERKNHILNNMIYGVDINSINVKIVKKNLPSKNIICADSLEYNFNMKFDVVIGNPPFQPNIEDSLESSRSGSGNKIWHKFIEKAFEITHEKSIIAMIAPSHWRAGNFSNSVVKKAQDLIWQYDFIVNKCKFDVANQLSIAYFIVNRSIKNSKNKILNHFKFYPIEKNTNFEKVCEFYNATLNEECYIADIGLHDSRRYDCIRKSSTGDNSHKYKHIVTPAQSKNNLFDWYSTATDGFYNKKVFLFTSVRLNNNGIKNGNKIALYNDGDVGSGHGAVAYTVNNKEEGEKLANFINNSKIIYDIFCEITGGDGFGIPVQAYKKIPKSFVERFNNGEDL